MFQIYLTPSISHTCPPGQHVYGAGVGGIHRYYLIYAYVGQWNFAWTCFAFHAGNSTLNGVVPSNLSEAAHTCTL